VPEQAPHKLEDRELLIFDCGSYDRRSSHLIESPAGLLREISAAKPKRRVLAYEQQIGLSTESSIPGTKPTGPIETGVSLETTSKNTPF
jgi:hypothetical protein